MTIQMSEFFNVPLIASSYGGVDLGLKSHMKEAWDRTHDPWVTRRAALPLYHWGTLSQYFNLLISNKRAADISPCPTTALTSNKYHNFVNKLIKFQENIAISQTVFKLQSGRKYITEITKIVSWFKEP